MKSFSQYSKDDGKLTTHQVHGQDRPPDTETHAWIEGAHDAAVWSVDVATGELLAVPSIEPVTLPTMLAPDA